MGSASGRSGREARAGAQLVRRRQPTVVGRSCRGRSPVPGAPSRPPLPRGRKGGCLASSSPSEGRLRLPSAQTGASRAMEPSGSLFPSLVVVGHAITLAAVWHWRKGRPRVQDEQGKAAVATSRVAVFCHHPARGLRAGRARGRLPPAPKFPYARPFLSWKIARAVARQCVDPRPTPCAEDPSCMSGQGQDSASVSLEPAAGQGVKGGLGEAWAAGEGAARGRGLPSRREALP